MRDARTAALICAGFLVLWMSWGQLSPGTFNDDDVAHYFMARESLTDPSLWITLWGRPLYTFLYSFPAQLGYGAVEITTAVIMALTLWMTWLVAGALGLRHRTTAVFLTGLQPFFFKLGFANLVEPLGALCLISAIWALLRRRDVLAAILAGLLPLTRLELIVVVPFLLEPVLRRSWVRLLPAVVPMLVWNVAGWFFHGDPVWLANQILGGHFTRSFAGALGPEHYFVSLPLITGGALFPLFAVGLLDRWRGTLPGINRVRAIFLTALVTLAFLAWDIHGFGGSVGYLRHLVAVGPLIGLIAAWGAERWEASRSRPVIWLVAFAGFLFCVAVAVFRVDLRVWEHPVNRNVEPWVWPVAAALGILAMAGTHVGSRLFRGGHWIVGVVIVAAGATLAAEPPIPLDGERELMREATEWVDRYGARTRLRDRVVAVNHPWFFFLGEHDRYDRVRFPVLDQATLERLAPGSLVIWESHYGHRLTGDVPMDYFAGRPSRYVLLHKNRVTWQVPRSDVTAAFSFLIFEVVAPGRPS